MMSSSTESNLDFIEIVTCMLNTYQEKTENEDPAPSPEKFVKENFCEKQLFVNHMQEKCVALFFEICSLRPFLEEIIEDGEFSPTVEGLLTVYFLMFYISPSNVDEILAHLVQHFGLEAVDLISKYMTRENLLNIASEKYSNVYPPNKHQETILMDIEDRIPLYRHVSEKLDIAKSSSTSRPYKADEGEFQEVHRFLIDYMNDPNRSPMDIEESIWSPRNTTDSSFFDSKTKIEDASHRTQYSKRLKIDLSLPLGQQTESKRGRTLNKIEEEQLSNLDTSHTTSRRSKALPEVRNTTAQVLREGARVQKKAEESERILKDLCAGSADPFYAAKLLDEVREEDNAIQLTSIEKKHLLGLLSHEEARIAKAAVFKANRVRALELKQQSQELEAQLQEWRRLEMVRLRETAERNQFNIEQARLAQANLLNKKRQTAKQIQEESRELQRRIDEQRKQELDQKISLIRQIKELEQISKSSTARDCSHSCDSRSQISSIAVNCQMSVIQLKDALAKVREKVREQVQRRREKIRFEHMRQQKLLQDTIRRIERYKNVPKPSKAKAASIKETALSSDLVKLRKKLELKRLQAASAGNF